MTPLVSIVVAHDLNGVIGYRGKLPWHEPADLKRFQQITVGDWVVYGFNTFRSLNYKPLPRRRNIVLTSAANLHNEGYDVARSLDDAIKIVLDNNENRIHLCGGPRLYTEALDRDMVDVAFITIIKTAKEYAGTDVTHFKEYQDFEDAEKWELRTRIHFSETLEFRLYHRRGKLFNL